MGKPRQFEGELWKQSMEGRTFNSEPGYVTVLMKFPAEIAGDVYTYFNQLGIQPTPFALTLPELPDGDVIRQHREKRREERRVAARIERLIRGRADD